MNATKTLPQFVLDLLASPPKRGGGLNRWFYRVARVLHPFRDPGEIVNLLTAATAGESVKHGEIERAVERSKETAWKPGQAPRPQAPAWPSVNQEQRKAVVTTGGGLVDLWEASRMRIEDNDSHTEEIISTLFPGDPLLCVGESNAKFQTKLRSEWRGKLAASQLIVPSPMTARAGLTQEGKESAHALSITGPRRFLVIEQDHGTIDEQAAVLLYLEKYAPLAVAVHSGGKSIHGWFYCAGQPEEKLLRFMQYAVKLGADSQLWVRSQFARMPDGRRDNGRRQVVYFFNPEVIS